jgi:phage terminase large subunit-like protein
MPLHLWRWGTKSTERIDGIVATIMATGRAMVAEEEPQPEYTLHFV